MVLAFAAASTAMYFIQAAGKQVDRLHPDSIKGIPDPTWISMLWIAVPLAPFLLSLVFLSTRSAALVAAGAGLAAGLFAMFLLFARPMGMGLFLFFGLSRAPYFFQTAISVLVLLVISPWAIIAAIWTGKANWIAWSAAAGAMIIYIPAALGSLQNASIEFHRSAERQKLEDEFYRHRPRPVGARQSLMHLASCLFSNYYARPTVYPKAIDPWTRWGCDTEFDAKLVPDFKLSYAPQPNPVSGYVVDFQLVALPKKKGVAGRNPLMIDSRGIVFVKDGWAEGGPSKIVATPGDGELSQIVALKGNIERYMKEENGGAAPTTLNARVVGTLPYETPAIDENGTYYMETKNFSYVYLYKPQTPNQFGLIIQCQSYAVNCLRSYFLDYDGVIHGTAEPRQPTREDPIALECEFAPSECKDVTWSAQ